MKEGRKLFYIGLVVLLVAVSGCSGGSKGGGTGLTSLAGKVDYYDLMGQPAAPKSIIVGVTGTNTWDTAVDESTGAYRIEDIPAGSYQVVVKQVASLPPDTTFLMEPPRGLSVELKARIPMIGVDLKIIAMPGLPNL